MPSVWEPVWEQTAKTVEEEPEVVIMNARWLIVILLVGLLVGVTSATTVTIYPDWQNTSVSNCYNSTFTQCRDYGSGYGDPLSGTAAVPSLYSSSYTDKYNVFYVVLLQFNTSSIPTDATITNASFSEVIVNKDTDLGTTTLGITEVKLTDNAHISDDDWRKWTSNEYITQVPFASISAGRNEFYFTNLTFIQKGNGGYSPMALRLGWDIDNATTGLIWYSEAGTDTNVRTLYNTDPSLRPYINITYSVPTPTTYPVLLINETRIFPNVDTNLPPQGLNISINATRGEYEPASFVIKANGAISDLALTTNDMSDGSGHTIPKENIKIQTLKVWYQANNGTSIADYDHETMAPFLVPELLLNNDSIVRVNITAQTNELWIKNSTFEGYFHIDNQSIDQFPADAQVYDNTTALGFPQPFALTTNENRQIWITTYIPQSQTTGTYTGKIWINSSTTNPVAMNFSVKVLPFTLANATLQHGLFYMGEVTNPDPTNNINSATSRHSGNKTQANYLADLVNMKDHGVMYPVIYQYWADTTTNAATHTNFETALSLISSSGIAKDKLYLTQGFLTEGGSAITQDPTELSILGTNVQELLSELNSNGINNFYVLGEDEPLAATQLLEIPSHQTIISNGAYTFSDGWPQGTLHGLDTLTNYLNESLISAYWDPGYNTTERDYWQSKGKKIYVYDYPQAGVENPEIYRQHYGLELWVSGWDGMINFAYQYKYGNNIWNDFDAPTTDFREQSFTYPATDHPINTIQWEGLREGINDARYADTLSNITGNKTEATTIINNGIAANQDMSVIRTTLSDHIVAYGDTIHPTASFTKNSTGGLLPVSVAFTDTSSGTPTAWNWNFGDGNWTNGTTQNPSYTYSYAGTYQVYLIASNAAGNNQSANQTIIITAPDTTAPRSITGLSNGTVTNNSILWQWTNPTDTDFNHTVQYKNGVMYYNSSNTTSAIVWTGLTNNTAYTFSSHTVDLSGNMNATWVNATATTNKFATPPTIPPLISTTGASNDIVAALNIGSILLIVVGIILTIAGLMGISGGRYNSGTTALFAGGIISIVIGAILLFITYLILSPLLNILG
jgi:PKD repeat protein